MITLISGTNRTNSWTGKVVDVYKSRLRLKGVKFESLDLRDLPLDIMKIDMYKKRSDKFLAVENEFLIPAKKFIFIMPEYNGSYPGILKLMLDISDIEKCYFYKKAVLVGVSSGRAGNVRGMDDLTNVLNYLRIDVSYLKIPISRVSEQFDEKGEFISDETILLFDQQINLLVNM
ncbi:MAG: NAD(P)H-dependent oxidoreductase [Chitinophagales bacterium]|nr:NAD(P)H-dependent oxidoreductase [Chitinophagales bacterium]